MKVHHLQNVQNAKSYLTDVKKVCVYVCVCVYVL